MLTYKEIEGKKWIVARTKLESTTDFVQCCEKHGIKYITLCDGSYEDFDGYGSKTRYTYTFLVEKELPKRRYRYVECVHTRENYCAYTQYSCGDTICKKCGKILMSEDDNMTRTSGYVDFSPGRVKILDVNGNREELDT